MVLVCKLSWDVIRSWNVNVLYCIISYLARYATCFKVVDTVGLHIYNQPSCQAGIIHLKPPRICDNVRIAFIWCWTSCIATIRWLGRAVLSVNISQIPCPLSQESVGLWRRKNFEQSAPRYCQSRSCNPMTVTSELLPQSSMIRGYERSVSMKICLTKNPELFEKRLLGEAVNGRGGCQFTLRARGVI